MAYVWKNHVVLVTGAATGIGAAIVKQALIEEAKHVAVLDLDESAGIKLEKELNSKYGDDKVKFYKCDVTNDEVFLGIFKTVKEKQGYIDVVVNNAGLMNDRPSVYKKEIEVNVTSVVTGTLHAYDIMRKDRGGRGGTVINISSLAAITQNIVLPIYCATKSAVLQFSNCMGEEGYFNKTGVRVLVICFGPTRTALTTPQKMGTYDPDCEDLWTAIEEKFEYQTPERAAEGVSEAHKNGKSGDTWSINGGNIVNISSDVKQGFQVMCTNAF